MRVWLINPYGPLPGEGWRDYRFTYAARALAARGHEVTWWTASFDHHTKRFRERDSCGAGFQPASWGIALLPTPSYRRNIGIGRLRFERAFAKRMLDRGRSLPRPDVIIAADPPQFCGAAGRKLADLHRAAFVIDCLDLWPELFVTVAPRALRPFVRLAVQPLRAMRKKNVRAAALVIAVAEEYRQPLLADGARNAITIPIGVDVSALRVPRVAHDRLTLVYAGSLGEHYDLATVLEAMRSIDADLLIAGRGPAEERLRALAPPNVRFLGAIAPDELPRLYASADVGLAPYSAGSTVAMPLKVFDYLAAGLPVVTSLDGDFPATRYAAGNVVSLRDAIQRAVSTPAPPADTAQFDTRVLYERYADAIEAVAR
ncbi:MAG TPA: glycosyltransferase family 4 protein [Thermoanaerobaculia bacterium]|nr:glycosyltransferase family 4 protein [Thermoanaerobaculia bacterium]